MAKITGGSINIDELAKMAADMLLSEVKRETEEQKTVIETYEATNKGWDKQED